uniref:hypothetical protein n=1 Tax=Salmonella sp. s54496 TaxID=3159665 RepID=UPI0039809779
KLFPPVPQGILPQGQTSREYNSSSSLKQPEEKRLDDMETILIPGVTLVQPHEMKPSLFFRLRCWFSNIGGMSRTPCDDLHTSEVTEADVACMSQ